jgi:hypothetical protein
VVEVATSNCSAATRARAGRAAAFDGPARGGTLGNKRFYYVCASYDARGKSVCSNSLLLPMIGTDDEIIGKVSSLLDPEVVQGAIEDAVELIRAGQAGEGARREAMRRRWRRTPPN